MVVSARCVAWVPEPPSSAEWRAAAPTQTPSDQPATQGWEAVIWELAQPIVSETPPGSQPRQQRPPFQSPQDLCRRRDRATTRDLPREFTGRGHACAERSDRRRPRKTRRRPRKTRRPVSSSVVGVTVSTRREGSVLCSSGWLVNVRLLCERLWLPWDQPPAGVPGFWKTAWISLGKFPDVKSQEEKF